MRVKTVPGFVGLSIVMALVVGAGPAEAQAQAGPRWPWTASGTSPWRRTSGSRGLKGDVSVKGLPDIPIEKSFSDIWSDFHVGVLGHFEGRKDRWGFATDVMYMDLHAP